MKIRSITCFFNLDHPTLENSLDRLAALTNSAAHAFRDAGYEVQTTRLASTPFSEYLALHPDRSPLQLALWLESLATERGFAYLSLGPALPQSLECYPVIPDILSATRSVFLSGTLANASDGVSLPAVRAVADIIVRTATLAPDGFANLRFAAMANVPPFAPFFPAAYAASTEPAFALAIECADAAVDATLNAESIQSARQNLLSTLNSAGKELGNISNRLAEEHQIAFKGLDFSLAPFPQDWCSLGKALEQLSGAKLGFSGTLAAATILAETLDQGNWQRTGFNGLFLPVLEDSALARSTQDKHFSIKDLLLFSTVCGTGLDTVPLPGDTTPDQLIPVLIDLACLAIRLGKPLTARLMPIPGLQAGEMTQFQFDYFANGRVMELPAEPLGGLFTRSETIPLQPRRAAQRQTE